MSQLRSLLFTILFYANTVLWCLAIVPTFVLPRRTLVHVAQAWCRTSLSILRAVMGVQVEYRGLDRIPPGGFLLASKHQSLADILALMPALASPTFVLKRELTWIPFFGWYLIKAGMLPVDRARGARALVTLNKLAADAVATGRQVIIFPEGTRRPPGAEPDYKPGVALLYRSLGVPCVPVALNSGTVWPRRRIAFRRGTIIVEFLDPIGPGLGRDEFLRELQGRVEAASNRLLKQGSVAPPDLGSETMHREAAT